MFSRSRWSPADSPPTGHHSRLHRCRRQHGGSGYAPTYTQTRTNIRQNLTLFILHTCFVDLYTECTSMLYYNNTTLFYCSISVVIYTVVPVWGRAEVCLRIWCSSSSLCCSLFQPDLQTQWEWTTAGCVWCNALYPLNTTQHCQYE